MDRDTYLAGLRPLLPAIADRAVACEQLRRVPDDTFKAFNQAGLLRALQPKRWGGYELDPLTFYDGCIEVASVCASSAWVLGVVGVHNWQLALFPEQAQQDVWGDDSSAQISSSYAPTGKVERVDGGFRISGRWSFSSGCDHCDWVFLGGIVPGDGPPPDMRTFLLPRSDYEIDDNWHVAGLSGTGSKDIVVERAFVPEHRTHRFIDAFTFQSPGHAVNPSPLYRLPFASIFAFGIAVPAIGAGLGALATYRAQMREKLSAYDGKKVAEDPIAQARVSDAAGEIDAARALMHLTWEPMIALAEAGENIPLSQRIRARRNSADIVRRGMRAVDLLFEASGGRGIFLDNPMQRFFRDVHAMRAHAINNIDKASTLFGRAELMPDAPPSELFL